MATSNDTTESKESGKSNKPIIIKKINVSGHGHHGGAWKVAYADFVTAMMAFFLLLWLLNSVSSDKLAGIAEYFDPSVGLDGGKGIGFKGGTNNVQDHGIKNNEEAVGFKYGVTRTGEIIDIPKEGTVVTAEEADNEFSLAQNQIKQMIYDDHDNGYMKDSVHFSVTPEGLVINVADQDQYPMFEKGSATLTVYSKNILFKISNIIQTSSNFVAISGHTDKVYNPVEEVEYSEWELSADRANAARRYLVKSGVPLEQINRVSAFADNDPIDPDNKYSSSNRRIEIILLRKSITPNHKISAPRDSINEQAS